MNYQNFASYNNIPPEYTKEKEYILDKNNMTIQDIYKTPFLFLQEHKKNYGNMASTALKGIQSESELSKLFFSEENFKRLQKKIKKEIFKRTKGEFKLDVDQEHTDLFLVMRAIYLEFARFLPSKIIHQVKRLNIKVIEQVVPNMLTEIKQEYAYLKEINKPLEPIPRPMNINRAGRKQLASIFTTFGN